jgi:molecular chaperone DnaK
LFLSIALYEQIITQLGDPSVGGDQFDDILVDFVSQQILKLHSVDIRGDRYAMTMLAEAMEQAKVEL